MKKIAALSVLAILFFAFVPTAKAHPAPSVLHDYVVRLTERELTVESYLRVSPELVPEVYRKIDLNNDGRTSDAERETWVREHPSMLKVALSTGPLDLKMSPAPSISKEDLLVSIDHPVVVTYTAALGTPVSGKQRIQLTYGDNYLSYDEYYISVAGDVANDQRPQSVGRPQYPATFTIVYHMPTTEQKAYVPVGEIAAAPWTAGREQASSGNNSSSSSAPVGTGQVLDTLRTYRGDLWTGLGLLLLAVALGGLHAMTPGHGKTMVASYLIGSRGRVRDAVMLGGVVTFTHTFSIIVLGILLSIFPMPPALRPALELASGALVLLLGAYLFITRWREVRAGHAAPLGIGSPAPAPAHAPIPAMVPVSATSSGSGTLPVRPAAHTHAHTHTHTHTHTHDHDHSHPHNHDNAHSHGGKAHTHAHAGNHVSPKELIALGVSGGIVPCPDALAILLLSAGVGQFVLGLGLVVSFSLGLAAVLISLGVALVKMKGALERSRLSSFSQSDLWTRWVPVASAVIVVIVGTVMILTSLGSRWS